MPSIYHTIALLLSSITHHWNIVLPKHTNTFSSSPIPHFCLDALLLPILFSTSILLFLDHDNGTGNIHTAITMCVITFLRPLTKLVRFSWPLFLIPSKRIQQTSIIKYMIHGGPLGKGCSKVCEAISVYLLLYWKYKYNHQPHEENQKGYPKMNVALLFTYSWKVWIILFLFIQSTNVVLSIWSKSFHSKGDHVGVNAMVHSSLQRSLTYYEHIGLFALAFINAFCEEVTSRGFFLYAFIQHFDTNTTNSFRIANVCQAISFGIWHYHGIPSGMTGVLLTFVYGYIMGELWRYHDGGLALPILAHTIADYFIFSVIVRTNSRNAIMNINLF